MTPKKIFAMNTGANPVIAIITKEVNMRNSTSMLRLLAVSAFILSVGASPFAYGAGAGQYMDDASITAKVKAALMADSQMKATQISVETNQGTVQLSGTVDS